MGVRFTPPGSQAIIHVTELLGEFAFKTKPAAPQGKHKVQLHTAYVSKTTMAALLKALSYVPELLSHKDGLVALMPGDFWFWVTGDSKFLESWCGRESANSKHPVVLKLCTREQLHSLEYETALRDAWIPAADFTVLGQAGALTTAMQTCQRQLQLETTMHTISKALTVTLLKVEHVLHELRDTAKPAAQRKMTTERAAVIIDALGPLRIATNDMKHPTQDGAIVQFRADVMQAIGWIRASATPFEQPSLTTGTAARTDGLRVEDRIVLTGLTASTHLNGKKGTRRQQALVAMDVHAAAPPSQPRTRLQSSPHRSSPHRSSLATLVL